LVESHLSTLSSEYNTNPASNFREEAFQTILYIHLMKIGPPPGSYVFQTIIIIFAILVDGYLKTISTKYQSNLESVLEKKIFKVSYMMKNCPTHVY